MRLLFQLREPKFLEMHNSDIYRTVWIFIEQLGLYFMSYMHYFRKHVGFKVDSMHGTTSSKTSLIKQSSRPTLGILVLGPLPVIQRNRTLETIGLYTDVDPTKSCIMWQGRQEQVPLAGWLINFLTVLDTRRPRWRSSESWSSDIFCTCLQFPFGCLADLLSMHEVS